MAPLAGSATAQSGPVPLGTYQVDVTKGKAQMGEEAFVDQKTGWLILTHSPCQGQGKATLVWNGQPHTTGNHLVFSIKKTVVVCGVFEVIKL